jgi:FHA domain
MTDQVLDVLKLVLLALLYLFFARVLWAVWSEVRQPANIRAVDQFRAPAPAPTPAGGVPAPGIHRPSASPAATRGTPTRLVILEPTERSGTSFALDGTVRIGRDGDNTIVITDDAYISSHHASITQSGGQVVVEDLTSRNGTYLNGAKVTRRQTVHPGDRVQVGYTVLEAQ